MSSKCFTLGIYEDRPPYFGFLAAAARDFVKECLLEEVNIVWYRLNRKLLDWTVNVDRGHTDRNSYPFGEKPLLIHLNANDYKLPGEAAGIKWADFCDRLYGQKDIPVEYFADEPTPGMFYEIEYQSQIPLPNVLVVDHELFRKETAEAHSQQGSARSIITGLRQYYGGEWETPPIFLSSYRSLASEAKLNTLEIGRGRGTRTSWFPRSDEKRPTRLPNGFAAALREEVNLWVRNRELLGAKYGRNTWVSYNPPFDRVIVFCEQRDSKLRLESEPDVVLRDQSLSYGRRADDSLIRHSKAYLEIRRNVSQADVTRLRELVEEFPLPIVLLYLDTEENVCNLGDCGVLVQHIVATNGDVNEQLQTAAIDWVRRMVALDTVVGCDGLRQIRDELLRWRMSREVTKEARRIDKPLGQALLITGPTGAGKTAVSKWCHFYSNHVTKEDEDLRQLWNNIHVPNEVQGRIESLQEHCGPRGQQGPEFLRHWLCKIIEHGGETQSADADDILDALLLKAFKVASVRPWQVNLNGVTNHDEFVMQIAGAYPVWDGATWPNDWRAGKVLEAMNNSLILNEVGELGYEAQGLLLELVERGGPIQPRFAPIGGEIEAKNVLFIMATDRVDRIRDQLLYRSRMIRVPSLLDCIEDIPELARHRLLRRWCCLSELSEQLLKKWYYWPGNHRSLHTVLDYAAEVLPSNRRVIRTPDLIRALWKHDVFRIPRRLQNLVEWILEWPEIDIDDPTAAAMKVKGRKESVTAIAARRYGQLPPKEWNSLKKKLYKIADLTFEKSSVYFKTPLRLKTSQSMEDKQEFSRIAIDLFVLEIFRTFANYVERVKSAIESAKEIRNQKINEIVGKDFERQLAVELTDDAIVALSLGALLWHVLHAKPAEIESASKPVEITVGDESSTSKTATDTSDSEDADSEVNDDKLDLEADENEQEEDGANEALDTECFKQDYISHTRSWAGQYSLAVIRALDSTLRGTLFDYAESRRDRGHFSDRHS